MIDLLACLFVRALSGMLCILPPDVSVWLGERLGLLAYRLQPKRRRIGETNLRAAFDGSLTAHQTRRMIRECFKHMGAGIFELLRLPVMDLAYLERYVAVEHRERFEDAIKQGRPFLFLTGHYGNWELTSIAAALLGYPIMALARVQNKFPRLYNLLISFRESKGCTIIHKGGAMRRILAAMDERKLVGIVGDQASRQGIFHPFFGRPALFATGPFHIAYAKNALVVPAFIHRVRGPYHRIVIEEPIDLSSEKTEEEAFKRGVAGFAGLLAKHIKEDPVQWLWMHKRWKHTPEKRVLVLSDGKAGHEKQSQAVAHLLKERFESCRVRTVRIRYRNSVVRFFGLMWAWMFPSLSGSRCLRWVLEPESAQDLLSRYADFIVSCGSVTVVPNYIWSRANGAKSIVIMDPTPVPVKRFDLAIVPSHDRLPKSERVVEIEGALSVMDLHELRTSADALKNHPNYAEPTEKGKEGLAAATRTPAETAVKPMKTVAVFIGGDTPQYKVTPGFVDALIQQVQMACKESGGRFFVTTSRRTSDKVEALLQDTLKGNPLCHLLILASRDPLEGTMPGMLGASEVAVVTGESISMVSESSSSGLHVVVVEPPLKDDVRSIETKHRRFLRGLKEKGLIHLHPVDEVALTLKRVINAPPPEARLDNLGAVREALQRLVSR